MGNTLVNMRDQRFILFEQLGIDTLFATEKYADYSNDVVDMMLNEAVKNGRGCHSSHLRCS